MPPFHFWLYTQENEKPRLQQLTAVSSDDDIQVQMISSVAADKHSVVRLYTAIPMDFKGIALREIS